MLRVIVSIFVAWAAQGGFAPSAAAQDLYSADNPRPPASGTFPLSLQDAISIGLANNLDVEVERYAPLIAEQSREGAWGAYDPELFAEFGYADTETPTANALQAGNGVTNKVLDGSGGFRGLVPYLGASYEIALTGERTKTTQTIQTLSPELTSGLSLSGSIPLLRGLLWNEAWTNVKSTEILHEISREFFREQVMDIVQRITNEYWGLVAAKERLRVAERSVETAKALLDQTETQYEVGVVSRVDVVEAEAGLAERQFDRISTNNAYLNAQDRLIDVVLGPYLKGDETLAFQPSDDPEAYITYEIDVVEAVSSAFAMRPELAARRDEIENNEMRARFAKNQRLPQLDLRLAYGFQGLAGDQNPDATSFGGGTTQALNTIVIPDINEGLTEAGVTNQVAPIPVPPPAPLAVGNDFNSTFDDYFQRDGADQYSVRGVFSIPFPNTTARKRATQAELEVRRSKTALKRLEQQIVLQVRKAARGVEAAQQGIEAAERRRLATAEQVRAEKVRLEHGESTPFDVLLRDRDLTEAESQKITALQVYRDSVTGLDRAQGTILAARNVEIQAVANRPLKRY